MQFLKKNIWTICCLTLVVLLGSVDSAFAQAKAQDLMGTAQSKAVAVFKSVKAIIFVVGGFGLVALAFMAIFGKLDWKKFAMLAVGLAILAAAGAVVLVGAQLRPPLFVRGPLQAVRSLSVFHGARQRNRPLTEAGKRRRQAGDKYRAGGKKPGESPAEDTPPGLFPQWWKNRAPSG